MRLKEKEELKIQSFDTGSFMHETIDEFFKKVKNENISLPELVTDEEKIQNLVDTVVEEKLDMGKKYTFVATPKYKVLVKRLKRIVAKATKIHKLKDLYIVNLILKEQKLNLVKKENTNQF